MDKLAFETLEKLLDEKLSNLNEKINNYKESNTEEFRRMGISMRTANRGIEQLKTTTNNIHSEAKRTNGRVSSLESNLEETNARVWNLEQYQAVCPIREMKNKLDIIDSATSFKQALVKNPKIGKRIFWGVIVFILLVSLPIWIAYWDVITDLIGSLSRVTN